MVETVCFCQIVWTGGHSIAAQRTYVLITAEEEGQLNTRDTFICIAPTVYKAGQDTFQKHKRI